MICESRFDSQITWFLPTTKNNYQFDFMDTITPQAGYAPPQANKKHSLLRKLHPNLPKNKKTVTPIF